MFFSTDLLSKKSPLGVVWLVSHGKKVSKQKIMQIKVNDMCNMLLDPEVPHALRLQGILCNGVTLIYSRQQSYLLHDCQETMKRLLHLIMPPRSELTMLTAKNEAAALHTITMDEQHISLDELFGLQQLPQSIGAGPGNQDDFFYADWELEQTQQGTWPRAMGSAGVPAADSGDQAADNRRSAAGKHWPGIPASPFGLRMPDQQNMLQDDPNMSIAIEEFQRPEPETFEVPEDSAEKELEEKLFELELMPEVDEMMVPGEPPDGQRQAAETHGSPDGRHVLDGEDRTETAGGDPLTGASPLQAEQEALGGDSTARYKGSPLSEEPVPAAGGPGGAQRQRKKRGRKPAVDTDVLINTHSYREWQQNHEDILSEGRTLKQRRLMALEAFRTSHTVFELQNMPAVHEMCNNNEFEELFAAVVKHRLTPGPEHRELQPEGALAMSGKEADDHLHSHRQLSPHQPPFEVNEAHPLHLQEEDPHMGAATRTADDGMLAHYMAAESQQWDELEEQDKVGQMPALSEGAGILRRASSIPRPTSSSDLETEHLRAMGSTPGTANGYCPFPPGSMSPASMAAYFHKGAGRSGASNEILGKASWSSAGGMTGRGSAVPDLDIRSPIRLPRFQGLVDTPSEGGETGAKARLEQLLQVPGGSNQKGGLLMGGGLLGEEEESGEEGQHPSEGGLIRRERKRSVAAEDITEETLKCMEDVNDAFNMLPSAGSQLSFFGLTDSLTRSQAATFFYQVLLMNSHGFLEAQQAEAFGDITLLRGSAAPGLHHN
mmetsp:Transcript_4305/g.12129  ORF Transcript_4305/g.12129 Transcript_4305/m.12129 type:complete len:774 (-) Transcript_4305:153-2474(-)